MASKDRQAAHKARQIELGRVRRPIYATPDEFDQVKDLLSQLRSPIKKPS